MGCDIVEELPLDIVRGKGFSFAIYPEEDDGSVMNLASFTGRGEIRDVDGATTVLLATFTVAITAPPLTGDDLTEAQAAGAGANHYRVLVSLLGSDTDHSVTAIETANNEGVYDVEAVNGTDIKLVARGPVTFYYDRTHL